MKNEIKVRKSIICFYIFENMKSLTDKIIDRLSYLEETEGGIQITDEIKENGTQIPSEKAVIAYIDGLRSDQIHENSNTIPTGKAIKDYIDQAMDKYVYPTEKLSPSITGESGKNIPTDGAVAKYVTQLLDQTINQLNEILRDYETRIGTLEAALSSG